MPRAMIICGGRDHPQLTSVQCAWLDSLHATYTIAEVIIGSADGADNEGQNWARSQGINCTTMWANWTAHGSSGGPRRNRRMLEYLLLRSALLQMMPMLVAFPGGQETADMVKQAQAKGVSVVTWAAYAASQMAQGPIHSAERDSNA